MATILLQARMGSTRLPGKSMADLCGKPLLAHVIEILTETPRISRVVLCTTNLTQDDVLIDLARQYHINHFRGSETNVLDRFYQASLSFPDSVYFRATGDNPLIDPKGIGRILPYLESGEWDYVCEQGLPVGAVVEGLTESCLHKSHDWAYSIEDLEHVTLFCKHSGLFRCHYPIAPLSHHGPDLRLTVDTPDDLKRARSLVELGFGGVNCDFPSMVKTLQKGG